jgi:uncharacterized SAM-binding protein YcdF (DUF218 family)
MPTSVIEILKEIQLLCAICRIKPTGATVGVCLEGDATLRLAATANLYRSGRISHVIVSGGVPERELDRLPAKDMKQELVSEGVPEQVIYLEEESTNTYHHGQKVIPMALALGFRELLIITSGYHLLRAYRTILRAVLQSNRSCSLYGYPAGSAWTWLLRSRTEQRPRFLVFLTELEKLKRYQSHVASYDETWRYVNSLRVR